MIISTVVLFCVGTGRVQQWSLESYTLMIFSIYNQTEHDTQIRASAVTGSRYVPSGL
jgi:hypothetical protein